MKSFLVGLVLSLSQVLLATPPEIHWYKLERNFLYKDIDRYCDSHFAPVTLLMSVEVANGAVKGALIRDNFGDFLVKKVPFTATELAGIQLKADAGGKKWIESVKLSARLLNWIFFQSGSMGCSPTQPLASIGPNEFNYTFNLANMLVSPAELISNVGDFYGQRKDGRYYQAILTLTQQKLP